MTVASEIGERLKHTIIGCFEILLKPQTIVVKQASCAPLFLFKIFGY